MQTGWGISKKTSVKSCVTMIVIMLLVGMLSGCGNNPSDKQKTSTAGGSSKAALFNDASATGNPLAAEQNAGIFQSNDSGSTQGATTVQIGDNISSPPEGSLEPSSATPHGSSVSGVENVSGPFGPFPSESGTISRPSPNDTAPPPEAPETPRGPFGPFPDSQ